MEQTKLIKNSGIVIPHFVGENNLTYIKDFLTRVVPSYQNSPSTKLKFYLENESGDIKVPRYFPIDKFINTPIDDITQEGQDIEIKHNIVLRDSLQETIVNYMLTNRKGIIQANPGAGKTITTIFAICELRKKTLILVHRDSLAEQWEGPGTPEKKQGFLAHTNISKDEIGRLSSANFKECLKKSIVIATNQTFVSLLKRHRNEFLKELKTANFGILISDEAHTTTGAPTFSECSLHIPIYRTFGLSATPNRQDGTTDIMEYHLGPVYIPEGKSSTMDARITVVLVDLKISSSKSRPYVYWGGYFQRARYLNLLSKNKTLIDISKNLIKKFYNDDRNILYVADRIKLIDNVDEVCNYDSTSKFVGSAKNDKLDYKLTYATTGKVRDGVDAVDKDCLIMPNPIGNIEQLGGRILRIKDGKKHPIIVDIIDFGEKNMSRSFNPRLNFYKKKNWEVKFIFADEKGMRNISEEEAQDILFSE